MNQYTNHNEPIHMYTAQFKQNCITIVYTPHNTTLGCRMTIKGSTCIMHRELGLGTRLCIILLLRSCTWKNRGERFIAKLYSSHQTQWPVAVGPLRAWIHTTGKQRRGLGVSRGACVHGIVHVHVLANGDRGRMTQLYYLTTECHHSVIIHSTDIQVYYICIDPVILNTYCLLVLNA